jgi:YfiR/HmsC-like
MSVRRFRLVTLPLVGLALAGLALGAVASPTMAQDVPVPAAVQVPLLLKILTFDRHLAAAAEPLVVGVVFQRRNRASAAIGDEVRVLLAASARPIRVIVIDLDETGDLRGMLLRESVQVVYIAPLQAVSVSTLTEATRGEGVVSITGVPRYVEQGLAVGLDMSDSRPRIVINLAASRAEGADFSAELLKLARLAGPKALPQ